MDVPMVNVLLAELVKVGAAGGAVACTFSVKSWVAFGRSPLLAVITTEYGAPLVLGGVPLSTPVVEFKVAHVGRLTEVKVGAGKPAADMVKLPNSPTVKVVVLALVKFGAIDPGIIKKASCS